MTDDRTPTANIAPFGLRMQPSLKAKVEASAKANNRSMNAEIVYRIEESLARDRWLNDMMASGNDESDEGGGAENKSTMIVAPDGITEEQLMRIINDAMNEGKLATLEKIAANFRKIDGKYIPFKMEGNDTTKE